MEKEKLNELYAKFVKAEGKDFTSASREFNDETLIINMGGRPSIEIDYFGGDVFYVMNARNRQSTEIIGVHNVIDILLMILI